MEPVSGVSVSVMVYGNEECGMFEGVSRLWPALESSVDEVPARGLFAMGFDDGCEWAGGWMGEGVMIGASVVKRSPVESPIKWENGL